MNNNSNFSCFLLFFLYLIKLLLLYIFIKKLISYKNTNIHNID